MSISKELGLPKYVREPVITRDVSESILNEYDEVKNAKELDIQFGETRRENLQKKRAILEHPEFMRRAREGYITFGMIKPNPSDSKLKDLGYDTNEEAANYIKKMIPSTLSTIMSETIYFTPDDYDYFYGHIREKVGENAYMESRDKFVGEPLEMFVLESETPDARQQWRDAMGPTNPNNAPEGTIRFFALGIDKNLVHGTSQETTEDGAYNITKELGVLRTKISEYLIADAHSYEHDFPSPNELREKDLLKKNEGIVLVHKKPEQRNISGLHEYYDVIKSTPRGIEKVLFTRPRSGNDEGKQTAA